MQHRFQNPDSHVLRRILIITSCLVTRPCCLVILLGRNEEPEKMRHYYFSKLCMTINSSGVN